MGLLGMFGKKNLETTKVPQRKPMHALKAPATRKSQKEEQAPAVESPDRGAVAFKTEGFSAVLLGPRITEKATYISEHASVYTFNISPDANKNTVSEAVSKLYKVHPEKVRIVTIPSKRVFVRGKRGVKSGGRKAYVYLKKGEKIETA